MHNGYLKLYRKIANNPLWTKKPFSDGQAWVDLLLVANHKAGVIDKRGNRIKVERGQVGYSVLGLSDRWGWSRGKVDRFLKYLENEHQIEQQKNNVTTLITILNYEEYNGTDTKKDNRQTADEQQTDTNKNEKKETCVRVIQYLNTKTGKNYKTTTDSTVKLINARLKEGFAPEDFKTVIDNQCREWLNDPEMEKYLRPATLFMASKFDGYLQNTKAKSTGAYY